LSAIATRGAFLRLADPVSCAVSARELVWALTRQRIVLRYRGSVLGVVWSVLSPALTLGIFTFVFGVMLRPRWSPESTDTTEFALLLYLGLCVFWFVSECVSESPSLIANHSPYVKKVVFPLEILPWVSVSNALFHTAIRLVVYFAAAALLAPSPTWTAVLVPLVFVPLCLSTLGVCWILAAAGVFLRDLGEIVSLILTALLFLSPVFYSIDSVPESLRFLILANPISLPVDQLRDVAYRGALPDPTTWAALTGVSYALAWSGSAIFRRARSAFADVV
jgi:lipopolysaccharide transport system permease protein